MASTGHDSGGTTVSFPGLSGDITNISYSVSDGGQDTIDVSHLGQTAGEVAASLPRPLKGVGAGGEVQIDFIGDSVVEAGVSGTLTISGPFALSTTATCTASSVTVAVNDVIKGSATFRVE